MKNDNILRGYTTLQTAYKVDDYPYGFRLRTSIFYWIESKAKFGDRLGTYTINPKTGRPNKPKYGTYYPFLMMKLDEQGHVTTEGIDAYHTDEFKFKFYRILDKFGEEFLCQEQKDNIRINYARHLAGNAPYILARYSEEKKPEYKKWYANTIKHVLKCEFKDLTDYPDPPVEDNPEGEVKITIKEYEIDNK